MFGVDDDEDMGRSPPATDVFHAGGVGLFDEDGKSEGRGNALQKNFHNLQKNFHNLQKTHDNIRSFNSGMAGPRSFICPCFVEHY